MPRSRCLQLGNAASLASAVLMSVSLAGCRQDMQDQPKFYPQRSTTMYQDGRSVRPQVVGTVARSQSQAATYFATGLDNGAEGDGLPFKATLAVLERGQERYNIYCTPCHSRVGNGKGMIVQRGYYLARRGYMALSVVLEPKDYDGFVAAAGAVADEYASVLME